MAFKNITSETMLAISGAWLDPERSRRQIEKVPLLKHLLPSVEEAHGALLASGAPEAPDALSAKLAENSAEAAEADRRHDRKARGAWYLCTGLAELADDPAVARRLLDLRDRVVPKGLGTTSASYRDEAGHAETQRAALTDDDRARLAEIRSHGRRTLENEVDAWLEAGGALGRLVHARAALEAQAGAASSSARPDAARARNAWVRVANAVVSNAELARVDEAARIAILGSLLDAEAQADRRAADRRAEKAAGEGNKPDETEPKPGGGGT